MAKKRKAAPDVAASTLDLSTIDILLEGRSDTAAALKTYRQRLEAIIEPHVEAKPSSAASECETTLIVMQFRGKRRYLNSNRKTVRSAASALSFLDKLEAARKVDDVDAAIRFAIGFAQDSRDVFFLEAFRVDPVDAIAEKARRNRNLAESRKRRRSQAELRREAEVALAQAKRDFPNKGAVYQIERAAEACGIKRPQFYARLKFEGKT